MKTADAIKSLGSVIAVAELLGISQQAVYRWKEDVPELREFQLKARRPDLFGNNVDQKVAA